MKKMCSMLLVAAIAILLPIMISAECQCTASGDPHYVMCDKQTRFDFQAEGLFTAFKSDDLEVQVFQSMAKDMPVAYVDYCSIKFVKDDCQFVMKTRSIKEPNNVIMNGEKIVVSNGPAFISKELDKNLGITMDSNYDMVFKTKEGVVHVICKPQEMIIRAPTTSKCEGLCGDCSGKPQTKPVKPIQHACKEIQQPSGSCKPKPAATPAPSTPPPTNGTRAPTTPAPSNGTAAPTTPPPTNSTMAPTTNPTPASVNNATSAPTATPAPTTAATPAPTNGTIAAPNTTAPAPSPIMNATSAPTSMPTSTSNATNNATSAPTSVPTLPPVNASVAPPPVKEADKSQIVGHPVFESEEVMKKVINACMCGQPKERMEADKQFGGFVESCIYDKSLGPNEENAAASNMEAFLKSVTPIPAVTFNNDSAAAASVPVLPEITVIGNLSYSNANFDTSPIREKHVTKRPSEIHPTVGVSYKLRFTIPDEDVALIPQLMPRSQVFTGTGERSETIAPSSAQQMAMIQYGMPVPPSLISPAGASMPASTASMPASTASMPASTASMPAPGASMPASTASMPAPGASMPASAASMPASAASMPASTASMSAPGASSPTQPASPQGSSPATYLAPSLSRPAMGARPEERSGDRIPSGDKFPSNSPNDDDNKLKVRFELEAPVIFSAK